MSKSLLADKASRYNSLPKILHKTTQLIDKQRGCTDENANQLEINFLMKYIRKEDPKAKFTDENFRIRFFRWNNPDPDKNQRPGKRIEWMAISALTKYTYGSCKFASTADFCRCTLDIIKTVRKEINRLDFSKLNFYLDLNNIGEILATYLKLQPEDSVAELIDALIRSSVVYDYTAKSLIFKALQQNTNAYYYEDQSLADLISGHPHQPQKYVNNRLIKKYLLKQIDAVIEQWDPLNTIIKTLEDHQKDFFCELHHITDLEVQLFIGLPNFEHEMHIRTYISSAQSKQLIKLNELYLYEKRKACLPWTLANIYSQISAEDQHIPIRLTPEGENLYWVRKCISYAARLLAFKASHFINSGGWVYAFKEGKDIGSPLFYLLEPCILNVKKGFN